MSQWWTAPCYHNLMFTFLVAPESYFYIFQLHIQQKILFLLADFDWHQHNGRESLWVSLTGLQSAPRGSLLHHHRFTDPPTTKTCTYKHSWKTSAKICIMRPNGRSEMSCDFPIWTFPVIREQLHADFRCCRSSTTVLIMSESLICYKQVEFTDVFYHKALRSQLQKKVDAIRSDCFMTNKHTKDMVKVSVKDVTVGEIIVILNQRVAWTSCCRPTILSGLLAFSATYCFGPYLLVPVSWVYVIEGSSHWQSLGHYLVPGFKWLHQQMFDLCRC